VIDRYPLVVVLASAGRDDANRCAGRGGPARARPGRSRVRPAMDLCINTTGPARPSPVPDKLFDSLDHNFLD